MGGELDIRQLKKLIGQMQLSTTSSNTSTPQGYFPAQPPQTYPYLGQPIWNGKPPSLSDTDIELMAICIANKHPQVEGRNGCFCMLKRLEKGISKD